MKKSHLIFAFFAVLFCSFSANGVTVYPEIVYPENYSYESEKLSDGNNISLTPQWIQKADFLGDENCGNNFAVSGEYFFVYQKATNKLLRFDRIHGIFDKELEIDFGNFTSHDISHFGVDDAGNLFVSSGCELNNVTVKDFAFPTLTISVLNENAQIVKQLKTVEPFKMTFGANGVYKGTAIYNSISIRGNIMTESDFLVALPLMAKMYDEDNTIASKINLFCKSEQGNLLSLESQSPLSYRATETIKSNVNVTSIPFYPIYWQKNTKISDYIEKYFYAITYEFNKNKPIIVILHSQTQTDLSNLLNEGFGFNGNNKPGSIVCNYGDNNIIVDADTDENDNLHFNVREIIFKKGSKYTDVESCNKLWSIPQNEAFIQQTYNYTTPVTIQAVESEENEKPRVDLYFYAPGKIMGYYTLYDGTVSTGVASLIINSSKILSYENRQIKTSIDTTVKIYDISGRLQKSYNTIANQPIDISDMPSGIYIARAANEVVKILL